VFTLPPAGTRRATPPSTSSPQLPRPRAPSRLAPTGCAPPPLPPLPLPVRFLTRLQPALSAGQVQATRNALYRATLSMCFILLSLVPSVWGVLQLVPRYCVAPGGGVRADGLAFVATVLGLEAFMRVWLLAVFR
jgi:hypothetical protein